MDRIGLSVAAIHEHVLALQHQFLAAVESIAPLKAARLLTPVKTPQHGHFLSFETPEAASLHARLDRASIVTDVREDRIRFGFGCYHTQEDIAVAAAAVARALA
jgi:kynureninase